MTRLFIDTEFNGFGGELISMALVSDSGMLWYGVLPLPEKIDPWVAEHVIPVLHARIMGRAEWRRSLMNFLSMFDNPTIVADWYTDLHHFFGCFAGADHSESTAYACKAELVLIDSFKSRIPHNALSDAMAIAAAISERLAA